MIDVLETRKKAEHFQQNWNLVKKEDLIRPEAAGIVPTNRMNLFGKRSGLRSRLIPGQQRALHDVSRMNYAASGPFSRMAVASTRMHANPSP